ncbi:Nuclear pore protein 84/107 [Trypanosoma melophagium]|uniref:Nuclear pore protein 84/107 n=1 Tax=Trypanosoma melophagium TaxID=715481 RepID=UPI00351A0FAF|nr:Nuclear pore protein 84/107 [Trypanosoma melophagium]
MATAYEEMYGMLQLPPRGGKQMSLSKDTLFFRHGETDEEQDGPSVPPAQAFAGVYMEPVVRSVLTAEQFMRWSKRDRRVEESNLWSLLLELLLDAEQSSKYNPDAIGIAEVQPQRRWYISHLAHIQDLLQRYPLLRRMNIVMRWLEQTYREGNTPLKLSASRSHEEAVLLRQIILSYLRGGELYRAIDLAVTAGDCTYSCVLSAAQMQSVVEPWFNVTPLVPLFGEYGNGEIDQEWAGNDHRLDNLSQLYEDFVEDSASSSGRTALGGLDAVIAAVLCGNLEVMEPAFMASGNWKDVMWCHLRSALVSCFTKTLMNAHIPVQAPYAALVTKITGSQDCWQDETARSVVNRLSERLQNTYLRAASLEEQLQMRVILQFLSPGGVDRLNISSEIYSKRRDGPQLVSHLLLCLDTAYNETLHSHSVQVYSNSLATALAQYAQSLAQISNYSTQDAMRAVIAMNLHLRDVRQRASVYASFLMACRRRELEVLSRQEVESNEAKLVQLFCKADPISAVRDEVMRLLNQQTEPNALLTHNPVAEAVMWRAMHATSQEEFVATLREALEACVRFWLAEPHAELDAIADVTGVLQRTILLNLHNQENVIGKMELIEAQFWITFTQIRMIADDHARSAAQLDIAYGGNDKTLVFQLAQEEAALLRELHELTQEGLANGGGLVHRSRSCITAVTWVVQIFVEEVTLSVRLAAPGTNVMLELLQNVFAIVEQMELLGYIDPALLPQESAKQLFDAVRAVRVACGQKAHDLLIMEAKKNTATH